MEARASNDRLAEKAEQYRFHSRVPMLCECDAPECRALVLIALEDYREIRRNRDNFFSAPGHASEEAELVKETPNYEVRRHTHDLDDGDGDNQRRYA